MSNYEVFNYFPLANSGPEFFDIDLAGPLELKGKTKNSKEKKGKAQNWNQSKAGTSKAKSGTHNSLKRPYRH